MPAEFIKSMGGSLPAWGMSAATPVVPVDFVRPVSIAKSPVGGGRMTKRIFISYRRDDSAGHAGHVFDRLLQEFGQDLLFRMSTPYRLASILCVYCAQRWRSATCCWPSSALTGSTPGTTTAIAASTPNRLCPH
jgi:hypothetical protein